MSSSSRLTPDQQRQQMPPPLYFPSKVLMSEPTAYDTQPAPHSNPPSFSFSSAPGYPHPYIASGSSLPTPSAGSSRVTSPTSADPISQWYGSRSEEPWSAYSRGEGGGPMPNYSGAMFRRPRTTAGSDTESVVTAQTTHTTPPTAYSTYSGDEPLAGDQDTPHIQDGIAKMSFPGPRKRGSRASSTLDVPRGKMKPMDLKCPHCGAETRTQSELKKHRLKHEKPFKCPIFGCDRSLEGFTTSNDLDRHKKSKHRIFPGGRAVKCYKCASERCTDQAKEWTRLDNFCQHLDRMHGEENKDELVKKSEVMYTKDDKISFAAGTDFDDSHDLAFQPNHDVLGFMGDQFSYMGNDGRGFGDSMHIDPTLDLTLSPPQPEFATLFPPPLEPSWPSSSHRSLDHITHTQSHNSSDQIQDPFNDMFGPSAPAMFHSSALPTSASHADDLIKLASMQGVDLHSLADALNRRLAGGDPSRSQDAPGIALAPNTFTQNEFPYFATPRQPSSISGHSQGMSNGTAFSAPMNAHSQHIGTASLEVATGAGRGEEKRYRCKYCPKLLPRQSTLKKHQKRHERLYGCTFPSCSKTFGSKDDWKRHENSQHFQVDTWQCDETQKALEYEGASEKPCGKLFHRKEIFAEHLKRTHHISDKTAVAEKCSQCHIASNSATSFWCGFCCTVQQLSGHGSKAWDERFNHIGDHFTEGRRVRDWVAETGQNNPNDDSQNELGDLGGTVTYPGHQQSQVNSAFFKDDDDEDDDDEDGEGEDEESDPDQGSFPTTTANLAPHQVHTNSSAPYVNPSDLYSRSTSTGSVPATRSGSLAAVFSTTSSTARPRSTSTTKRPRPETDTNPPPLISSTSHEHTAAFATQPQSHLQQQQHHRTSSFSLAPPHSLQPAISGMDTEIFCCQCGMGPFYNELHVQCVGYGNCAHVFCGECARGGRKRARSYSSRRG